MSAAFRAARALAPIPLCFALGAIAARATLRFAPARIAIDRAQPLVVVTGWGAFGALAFALLACAIAGATLTLVLASRHEPARQLGARTELAIVLAIAALALVASAAWPFVFSSDVYAYAAYGAMVRDGLDPYALLPAHAAGAFYGAARWQWSGIFPVCVYGPAYVALATALVSAGRACGVAATLGLFRLTGAAAFLASIPLAAIALSGRPARERSIALRAYALNPVVLWAVGEGHNDSWLVLVLAAAAALGRARPALGAALAGLSLALKAPGGGYGVAAALDGHFGRATRAAAAAGVAVAAVLGWAVMRPALGAVGTHGRYAPAVSLQGLTGVWPAALLALAAGLICVCRLLRGDRTGYAWLGIATMAALPNVYPWYALWLVPLGVAAGPGRAATALWAATICALARYLPDAVGTLDPGQARAAAVVAVLPLAYAVTDPTLRRLFKKAPEPS